MSSPLEKERSQLSFSPSGLSEVLFGNPAAIEEFLKYQEIIANDPILKFQPELIGESRVELFKVMCQKTLRYHELFNYNEGRKSVVRGFFQFQEQVVTSLHQGMFKPTIVNLGSEKQAAKWIPLADTYKVLGCYAQTELGHGSDVQSLETIAVFDKETDTFIFNSPTISSTKWWIGDLGKVANHVVTHAQLIVDGKNYGVQTFIVQIRDLETHKPLKGITVGDIGPKYGYNTKDNGYLRFENVRVPRDNMLAKYSKISKTGEFVRTGNEKIGYATMMTIRAIVISASPLFLSQMLTIAARYSAIRTQFPAEKGEEGAKNDNSQKREVTILDYQLQQEKLIPLIADNYAMFFTAERVVQLLEKNVERSLREDFSMMPDLHALLSGCKAVFTWTTLFGGERVRQACGGQGYSAYAGICTILQEFSPMATYEGENTVLLLQTARYLVKNLNKIMKGKPVSSFVDYLKYVDEDLNSKSSLSDLKELSNPEELRKALRFNALHCISQAGQTLMGGLADGLSPKDSWDKKAGIALCEAAVAHTVYFTYLTFVEKVNTIHDEKIKAVLFKLSTLYALNKIVEKPSAYFEGGYYTPVQLTIIRKGREYFIENLRRDTIGLVEAWLWSDNSLKSAIGRADGKAYETLFDWMKNKNRMNKPGLHKELMKELRSGL